LNQQREPIAIVFTVLWTIDPSFGIRTKSVQSIPAIRAQLRTTAESLDWQRTVPAAAIQSPPTFPFSSQKDSVDRSNIFSFLKYWTSLFKNRGAIHTLNSDSQKSCHCCD
jgi:hypothetical protein